MRRGSEGKLTARPFSSTTDLLLSEGKLFATHDAREKTNGESIISEIARDVILDLKRKSS
jgi:hypothetical protein